MALEDGEYRLEFMIGKTIKDIVHYEIQDRVIIEFTDGSHLEMEECIYVWFNGQRVESGKIE